MSSKQAAETSSKDRWPGWILPAGLAITAVMVLILRAMGRAWWCKGGEPWPWAGDIWSFHASQHLVDPYSFTHVLHGVAFYGLLFVLARRWAAGSTRMLLAIGLEAGWEILENTNAVIEKYRAETISLDYFGDSVLNSTADVLCCVLGYLAARSLPVWASVAGFVGTEVLLALWIRDGLLLNVLMLLVPLQAVKAWQMGAAHP